jgi:excisionase family DNA binding protein
MESITDNKLLRIPEVAAYLDVTPARAYELARTGALPTVKIGRQYRVDPTRLREWVATGGHTLPGGWKRETE